MPTFYARFEHGQPPVLHGCRVAAPDFATVVAGLVRVGVTVRSVSSDLPRTPLALWKSAPIVAASRVLFSAFLLVFMAGSWLGSADQVVDWIILGAITGAIIGAILIAERWLVARRTARTPLVVDVDHAASADLEGILWLSIPNRGNPSRGMALLGGAGMLCFLVYLFWQGAQHLFGPERLDVRVAFDLTFPMLMLLAFSLFPAETAAASLVPPRLQPQPSAT